ncbi:MAG: Lrp/AsnC family transcriptional regulator [Phycisphaeraceae bacterium]|nr:Lrp/AsnC family transcriptional regulator [Phycisphaeraceae bacterium]
MNQASVPISIDDPINASILAISEDKIDGFQRDPIGCIAQRSGVPAEVVLERIGAMLSAGVIRRVRQTLLTTSLAPGALVAWKIEPEKVDEAFDFFFRVDPFSGHVVIRSTDRQCPGSEFRLWTTLKVPAGFSLQKHCQYLAQRTGAEDFAVMPAKKVFALGVGHLRRRSLEPGTRSQKPTRVLDVRVEQLSDAEWQVLEALKREFAADELRMGVDLWKPRADEAGVTLEAFFDAAEQLSQRGIVGRFSTFLEHVKKLSDGSTVTRYNALFHWAVPPGREMEAGIEVGRHPVMTHAYWRDGGPRFNQVNIMGVAHGTDRDWLLAHKAAIDRHLAQAGIEVSYTNVFWGGRSEIKPSEVVPSAYHRWCAEQGIDPESMRA